MSQAHGRLPQIYTCGPRHVGLQRDHVGTGGFHKQHTLCYVLHATFLHIDIVTSIFEPL